MSAIWIILALAVSFFFAIRILTRYRRPVPEHTPEVVRNPIAIPVSPEMDRAEGRCVQETVQFFERELIESGLVRPESIPVLVERIRNKSAPFARLDTFRALVVDDDNLSLEEKRALGLNTRRKYPREFISHFRPEALSQIDPMTEVSTMHLRAYHCANRAKELREFKRLDIGIRQVKIRPTNDEDTCAAVRRFKKTHDIEHAPDLPLRNCHSTCCMCYFEPIIPD